MAVGKEKCYFCNQVIVASAIQLVNVSTVLHPLEGQILLHHLIG